MKDGNGDMGQVDGDVLGIKLYKKIKLLTYYHVLVTPKSTFI